MRNSSFALALLLAAGCGTSSNDADMGTGGDLSISMAVPTNFDTINSEILQPTCTFSVCHSAMGAASANNLDFTTNMATGSDAYNSLVNQPAQNKKAMAMGILRVKPCDADNSFLVTKIELKTDPDKDTDIGHHMPDVESEFLSPAQIQAIKDWINRGALEHEPVTVSGSTCTLVTDMASVD